MEALKEIFMIGLILAVVFAIAHILVGLYRIWQNRKYTEISEAYRKAVEKHQLSESKEYVMTMGDAVPKGNSSEYRIKNNKATRAKVFDRASRSGDHPIILGQEYPYWKESKIDTDYSSEEIEIINYQSQFDGAGHGGSFGGGGAAGSWGSDDNNSSSSYDSGSSDSGGSDSSSSD